MAGVFSTALCHGWDALSGVRARECHRKSSRSDPGGSRFWRHDTGPDVACATVSTRLPLGGLSGLIVGCFGWTGRCGVPADNPRRSGISPNAGLVDSRLLSMFYGSLRPPSRPDNTEPIRSDVPATERGGGSVRSSPRTPGAERWCLSPSEERQPLDVGLGG